MTKIFFRTFGCSLNRSDSEVMAGLLKEAKFQIVKELEDSDVVIINTCTVKGPSESHFFTLLEKIKSDFPFKKVIVAGCIAQTDSDKLHGYSLIGTSQLTNIVQVVEETINDNLVELLVKENLPRLNLPHVRNNPLVEIIPICEGCLGDPCAYCKVKSARGNLRSYPKDEIIKQAKDSLRQGVKELWLTAQDTGCYGKDIDSNLPELLKEIISIPGDFKVRLGMCNPNHALEFLPQLTEILKSNKMFKFLHIPVQSGCNEILKSMRRKYSVEDFKLIIRQLRREIPNITIATDVIVGFPGEDDAKFNDTLYLIRQITPDVLNISRFWPRPGTEAEKMDNQIHGKFSKPRSSLLTDIFHNIARMQNEKWVGWQGNVIIDEKGKDDSWVARNLSYKPIILKGDFRLGDSVFVKVKSVSSFDLRT